MTPLSTHKLQFRRALFIMLRYQSRGLAKAMVSSLAIPETVFDTLVQHQLIQLQNETYYLTQHGIDTAGHIFKGLPDLTLKPVTYRTVVGTIFISTVNFVGNQVTTYYLANDQGDETTDINQAYFLNQQQYREKKRLLMAYDLVAVLHTKLIDATPVQHPAPDYSSFFN